MDRSAAPRVLFPTTVNEVMETMAREPGAVLWAGGTALAETSGSSSTLDLPPVVVALSHVEELARGSRTDQDLEIGSMMSLDRLTKIGRETLPPTLPEAISGIGTPLIRCRATLGGHLTAVNPIGDLRPLLQLLDCRAEIRFLRERRGRRKSVPASRRIPIAGLDDSIGGAHGPALITRVSIPIFRWNFGRYRKVPLDDGRNLFFYAIARIEKNSLQEFRIACTDGFCGILRDREMEVSMAGRSLPLDPREIGTVLEAVRSMTKPLEERRYEQETILNLARGFLLKTAV